MSQPAADITAPHVAGMEEQDLQQVNNELLCSAAATSIAEHLSLSSNEGT